MAAATPVIKPAHRRRIDYWHRTFRAYLTGSNSQLTFWHDATRVNESFQPGVLGQYYQTFFEKADYPGPFDAAGIPMLNYHGAIGLQYNPIAIAQYGLGNYNLFLATRDADRQRKFLLAADWLVENLQLNAFGLRVWSHNFDFEYRDTLRAPWYSGLAQGQGISLLVRAARESPGSRYLEAAHSAFEPLNRSVQEGGVLYLGQLPDVWIEEYLVDPPTHVLNGMIWAGWGVYDYALATGDARAQRLVEQVLDTLQRSLPRYDTGFWSLYEQSGTRWRMIASPFYHALHVVQLRVLHLLSGRQVFQDYADRWAAYQENRFYRMRALLQKSAFKLLFY
jgi:heparosan-N-sulfate-glucuronate 5-epimerase